jgi:Zn-dependent protease with chaperone function
MDFFRAQDQARKRSKLLVFYFAAAVFGIAAIINLALWAGISATVEPPHSPPPLWDPARWLIVSLVVFGIIGAASAIRTMQFRQGGGAVAKSLGGRKVDASTSDPLERRLVNIVEEMAVASGVPMPEIYILDQESGINAFAAGLSSHNAAVAVTRGALEGLSRDELQGVMAHEFAHILNGDMRLNVRLAGVIFGIIVLAMIGRMLLHSVYFSGGGRSRGNSKGGGGIVVIIALALAVMLAGLIGEWFGRLIQAAVSRQREFLADAAAVQFTRNPDGIGGALKRIGGSVSRVETGSATGMGHFFFANAMKSSMGGPFATHPPLPQRIKAVDPQWDGKFSKPLQPDMRKVREDEKTAAKERKAGRSITGQPMIDAMVILGAVGNLNDQSIAKAHNLLESWPQELRDTIHQHEGAKAAYAALLLSKTEAVREKQMAIIESFFGGGGLKDVLDLEKMIAALPEGNRLPLAELCLPALHNMSEKEYRNLQKPLQQLIEADQQVSLFEACLMQLFTTGAGEAWESAPAKQKTSQLVEGVSRMLSRIVYLEAVDSDAAAKIFETATAELRQRWQSGVERVDANALKSEYWQEDFASLEALPLVVRKWVLEAAIKIVVYNQSISVDESELLRVIALTMDCPMPLVLPT